MRQGTRTRYSMLFAAVFGLFGLVVALPSVAQSPDEPVRPPVAPSPQQSVTRSPAHTVFPSFGEEYVIGIGDQLTVHVDNAPELSGSRTVQSNGTIDLPFLGRVVALGKTREELKDSIVDGLRGRYLRNPHVVVEVTLHASKALFIHGSVRQPGMYMSEGRATLLKLITLAGGPADNPGSTAFIIREVRRPGRTAPENGHENSEGDENGFTGDQGEEYELIRANISGLLKGNFDQNVLLEPGDIVNIPPADIFFVTGEVNEPGSYQLKDGTTLTQAISLARGLTFEAAKDRCTIFRDDIKTGKRLELKIDVGDVMSGKREDIAILPNDMIIVQNSKGRSIGGAILRALGAGAMRSVPYPRY